MLRQSYARSPNFISIYSNPPQNFSLPENIIFYISKNPKSAKIYEKLVNLCKYFYLKAQVITYDYSEPLINEITDSQFILRSFSNKIWLYGNFELEKCSDYFFASSISKKIYRCDIISFKMRRQFLTFNEFKIFTSSGTVKHLEFVHSIVYQENGIVPIDKLIEILPNLNFFKYWPLAEGHNPIKPETIQNLIAIPHFQNLKMFAISELGEAFDFEEFFDSLKKPWKIQIHLYFVSYITDIYFMQLYKFSKKIIKKGMLTKNIPPVIRINGDGPSFHRQMEYLQQTFIKKRDEIKFIKHCYKSVCSIL